jgi:chitinase
MDTDQSREDIAACQANGKTIILSMGGATYSGGGFQSPDAAVASAQNIWAMFGPEQPDSNVLRPFGSAVVDGFDYDFESATSNMVPFGVEMRRLMDEATAGGDKPYYITAAPQCPFPDHANEEALDGGVFFDIVQIQFYNNFCGISSFIEGAETQNNFNFGTWDDWAANISLNPNVKILLGIPANTGAGASYTDGSKLAAAIQYSKQYASFGGVMMWDMSQLYANDGFLEEVNSSL